MYKTAQRIIEEYPGVKMWILSSPAGRRLELKVGDEVPAGMWRLIAIWEA